MRCWDGFEVFPLWIDFETWMDYFSIICGNSNPNWRTPSFFRGVGIPPTRSLFLTLPSGKLFHNYGKSPCLRGKFTISMAIVNSYGHVSWENHHVSWENHHFSTKPEGKTDVTCRIFATNGDDGEPVTMSAQPSVPPVKRLGDIRRRWRERWACYIDFDWGL